MQICQPCSCRPWLDTAPKHCPDAPRRGWHKGKDKFWNARPPSCGDSKHRWLPGACHQGTACCPLGCLAMVAAAGISCRGEMGQRGGDGGEGTGRQPNLWQRTTYPARLQTRRRDQAYWRSNGLLKGKGTSCRVVGLTHGSTACPLDGFGQAA